MLRPEPGEDPRVCVPDNSKPPKEAFREQIEAAHERFKADQARFERRQEIGFRLFIANLVPYVMAVLVIVWSYRDAPPWTQVTVFGCLFYICISQWGQPYLAYKLQKRIQLEDKAKDPSSSINAPTTREGR